MGKICSGCHTELAKAKFSGKQWSSNNDDQRRCKQCTANNVTSRPIPRPAASKEIKAPSTPCYKIPSKEPFEYIDLEQAREKLKTVPDDVSCWICLEEKDLSEGASPLLRDCCCRGDHAGWAHYECLAKYSAQLVEKDLSIAISGGSFQPGMLHKHWIICPNCYKDYSNDLYVAMAAGHVKEIENMREEWLDSSLHQWLRCEAHMAFLHSLRYADKFQESYIDEIGLLSKKLLNDLLPKIKKKYFPRQRQLELRADVNRLGLSYYAEMKEDYETALNCEKRALEIFEMLDKGAIELSYEADYEVKIATVTDAIETYEKLLEGEGEERGGDGEGCSEVDVLELEKHRKLYELSVRDGDEFSRFAIEKGQKYADKLYEVNVVKAERLITKLLQGTKRIFGPKHPATIEVQETYERLTHRSLSVIHPSCEILKFDVVDYIRQTDSYVLKPPEFFPNDAEEKKYERFGGKKLPVPRYMCALSEVVPVVVFGIPKGPLHHLNGKFGETVQWGVSPNAEILCMPYVLEDYLIRFEDDELEETYIPPANVLMLMKGLPPADSTDLSDIIPSESEVRWGLEGAIAAQSSSSANDHVTLTAKDVEFIRNLSSAALCVEEGGEQKTDS